MNRSAKIDQFTMKYSSLIRWITIE